MKPQTMTTPGTGAIAVADERPPRHSGTIAEGDNSVIDGLPTSCTANFPVLVSSCGDEISYLQDELFLTDEAEAGILQAPKPSRKKSDLASRVPSKASSYISHLWLVPLLSRDEELYHFRKMHFLRFQSAMLQIEAATCRGHSGMLLEVETKLTQADATRTTLIEANLRLVVSLAKKYASEKMSVDELVSFGNMALVNAVDQFDYRRGCRFSTYAYQAIQRSFFSAFRSEHRSRERFAADEHEATQNLAKDASVADMAELNAAEARLEAQQLLMVLNPREQLIVKKRFGMIDGSGPRSFQKIADSIGLSKQRVASIFTSAMAKIRKAIAQTEINAGQNSLAT